MHKYQNARVKHNPARKQLMTGATEHSSFEVGKNNNWREKIIKLRQL